MKSLKKRKVLLVDDSVTSQLLVQNIFLDENIEILVASDATEAMNILTKIKPDLILLDIMMPEIDGYQMLGMLEKKSDVADIPVMMISAKTGASHVKKAIDSGAVDYVKKPIDVVDLLTRVKKVLNL